jgi:hypothetical protein
MIISIALFGIGIGGLLVFFVNKFAKKIAPVLLAIISAILAFSLPISLLWINSIPLEMDLIIKSVVHQHYFIELFLVLAVPFVLAGFIFSFAFTNFREKINKLYFFDLVGGGIGCFIALALFPHRGPFISSFVISLLAILASGLFAFKRIKLFALLIPAILIPVDLFFVYPQLQNVEPRVSIAKESGYKLGRKLYSDWDNFGFTVVRERTADSIEVTTNYSTYSHMFDARAFPNILDYKGAGLDEDQFYPFIAKPAPEDVGIVGVGSGRDVLIALVKGAKNVYGAEYNPTMFDVFKNRYKDYNGRLGDLPNVHIYNQEGRFFIRSSKRQYDVLMFDNAIALAAVNSGAFTLAEGYLYTVQGVVDYMNHLKPDGILYFSNPYPDYVRFVTIAREAFKVMGRENEFKDNIIVVNNNDSSYPRCKVLIKNGKFTQKEIHALLDFGKTEKIKPTLIYYPGCNLKTFAVTLVTTKDINKEYVLDKFEIRPSTDDWPFYSQAVRPESVQKVTLSNSDLYYTAPFLLLSAIAKYVLTFSLIFLLLPLLLLNLKGFKALKNKTSSIIYFACLGVGFMLVEIVLMQKYMLLLGHPIYSFSVVLASLMISSGIGSFVSERFKSPYRAILVGLAGILVSIVTSFLFSKYIGSNIIEFPFWQRVAIISALTGLSGIFMGFMMPSGIRAVSEVESSIPWLWSINGIFSVVASFISIYVSIIYGFNAVLWISAFFYIVGTVFFCFKLTVRE